MLLMLPVLLAFLQNTYLGEALWLFFVLLVLLMLGRAAFVFPISFMHNLWSREKLALREMIVIWSALTSLLTNERHTIATGTGTKQEQSQPLLQ